METPGNKILHESLHFINFKKFFGENLPEYDEHQSVNDKKIWVLKYLAIEAAVLAVEFLASVVPNNITSALAAKISCNTAAQYPHDYTTVLEQGLQKQGAYATARILYDCYLAANMNVHDINNPPADFLNRLSAKYGDKDFVESIAKLTFSLNINFRSITNPLHFMCLKHGGDFLALIDGMSIFETNHNDLITQIFDFNYHLILKDVFTISE
jgi:hypothetical protein